MSHDENDPATLRIRTLLQYKFDQIRPKPQPPASDDLMQQAKTRRKAKELATDAKVYADEHKLLVGLVSGFFTLLTLGGFRLWQKYRR